MIYYKPFSRSRVNRVNSHLLSMKNFNAIHPYFLHLSCSHPGLKTSLRRLTITPSYQVSTGEKTPPLLCFQMSPWRWVWTWSGCIDDYREKQSICSVTKHILWDAILCCLLKPPHALERVCVRVQALVTCGPHKLWAPPSLISSKSALGKTHSTTTLKWSFYYSTVI